MSEWKEVTIGNHIDLISGYAFKSVDFLSNQVASTLPVIKIKNVANGDVNMNDVVFHQYNENLEKFLLSKGDVLIAMTGNHPQAETQVVGDVSRYKLNEKALLNQRVGKLIVKDDTNLDFIYYLFKNDDVRYYLANQSSGSANQANISKGDILGLNLTIPLPTEQAAIATVLSSLDNKIDLLHRQNTTLEKMAETLFRQWFVEEAKEEWKTGKVFDYALHFKNSIQPQKNQSTLYFHYSIPSFDNAKNPIKEFGKEIQSNKYKVPEYCILFSKLNPHKDKRVWLLQNEVETNAICSTEFQVVLPKKKQHLYFLYGWLTLKENYNEIASGVGGTSGSHQRIDPNIIYDFQCPLIPECVITNFNIQIEPIFRKQVINQIQIRTLIGLRDTLLPKLMSGEVKVKDE